MKKLFDKVILMAFFSLPLLAVAQDQVLPFTNLNFDKLNLGAGWKLANSVSGDLESKTFVLESGKGILVNEPEKAPAVNLNTGIEHGDIDIEMDFMVLKGSRSGVLFQGRYELQLADSWGVKNCKSADCGGIPMQGGQSGGEAPICNVCKAPSLWQNLKIYFRAAKFDMQGKKIQNAKFLKVLLNGVAIQQDIRLAGPTTGAAFQDEKSTGPLLLESEQGAIAFRNISYKIFDKSALKIENLQYKYYEGDFQDLSYLDTAKAVRGGKTDELSWKVGDNVDQIGFKFSGSFNVQSPGMFRFELLGSGGTRFFVDDKLVIDQDGGNHHAWDVAVSLIELKAGNHTFSVSYFKNNKWDKPSLGLFAEGPGIMRYSLTAENSLPGPLGGTPLPVVVGKDPYILRGFAVNKQWKRGHCALVGDPMDINYTIDFNSGAIINVWKGGFADATPEWGERGGKPSEPIGSVIQISWAPSITRLENKKSTWPDSIMSSAEYKFSGYELDASRHPIYKYKIFQSEIEDRIFPEGEGKYLSREIIIKNSNSEKNLYVRVAEGKNIEALKNGMYAVNDRAYYVKIADDLKPMLRELNNKKELLVPVKIDNEQAKIKYSIIW